GRSQSLRATNRRGNAVVYCTHVWTAPCRNRATLERTARPDGTPGRAAQTNHRILARHEEEAFTRLRTHSPARHPVSRRTVRRRRRDCFTHAEGPFIAFDGARIDCVSDVTRARDCRAAL